MNVRLSISIEVFPMIEILYLIILFSNIHFNYQVHLIVSTVCGHCEITMRYLAGLQPGPLSLRQSVKYSECYTYQEDTEQQSLQA